MSDDKCVLMSIEPRWAEAIFDGMKDYEYRKKPPGIKPPYNVFLYATSPVQKVVGAIKIVGEVRDNIDIVIAMTYRDTPHEPREIRDYFGNRREACALKIGKRKKFDEPLELDFRPPQNFQYVTEDRIL